jgi:hypothetical protein
MKRFLLAGLSLALVLVLAHVGTAGPQPNNVKQMAKATEAVAMDGPRVAYASGGRIRTWNVVNGATSVIKGKYGSNREYATASAIAIAGKRVAWIKHVYFGNTELDHWLYTARVGGTARLLRRARGYNNTDCGLGGPQIDGLVGSGTFLAVSTWTLNDNGSNSWNKRLNLITPTGLRTIVSGPNGIVSASADANHITVIPLGSVSMDPGYCVSVPSTSVGVYIYSAHGALLNEFALSTHNSGVLRVAISGRQLVVLGSQRAVTLSVYDWQTGALVHSWPVAVSWRDGGFAVYGHLAVVQGRLGLHLVDLKTGKDVIVTRTNAGAFPAIGSRGLVYAVNPSKDGRPAKLVFVPMAKLLAMAG